VHTVDVLACSRRKIVAKFSNAKQRTGRRRPGDDGRGIRKTMEISLGFLVKMEMELDRCEYFSCTCVRVLSAIDNDDSLYRLSATW
jgi:hypothetical protein